MATQTDYYVLLGVSRQATDEQIRSAYRKLARQYHPDVNSASDAAERFKAVTEAYEVLTDPERRQRYDMFGSATGGVARRVARCAAPTSAWRSRSTSSTPFRVASASSRCLGSRRASAATGTARSRARRPRPAPPAM